MVSIAVESLVKSYNSTRVLHGICRAQQSWEAVVLIGPSSRGKSTFLRRLNQLEIAESGPPDEIFSNPKNDRTREFLRKVTTR